MPGVFTLLSGRYLIWPFAILIKSLFSSHSDFGSSFTEPTPVMTLPGEAGEVMLAISNLQSAMPNESAFRPVAVVLRIIISANELPSSCVRRFMPGVRLR